LVALGDDRNGATTVVKLFTGQMASFVTVLNSALSYSYGRINQLLSKANPIHWIPAAHLIGNL
jgi:hypothetical protein